MQSFAEQICWPNDKEQKMKIRKDYLRGSWDKSWKALLLVIGGGPFVSPLTLPSPEGRDDLNNLFKEK